MDLTHRFTVPTSIDEAWAAFNDLERIAPCFPGAALTSYDGEQFTGLVKVKLGPISMQYSGTGRFVERDEAAHRAVIEAKGRDKRGNGTAAANVRAELAAAGADETAVTVVTDLNVTGKPAQFGRGVMQDVSDKLLGQFASCLESKLAPEEASADPAADEVVGATVDSTEAAAPTAEQPAEASALRQAPPGLAGSPARPAAADASTAALDLGAAVLPVLVKRYAVHIVGTLIALLVLRAIRRRRRS